MGGTNWLSWASDLNVVNRRLKSFSVVVEWSVGASSARA